MSYQITQQYLPHRRQRPLADNTTEFHVLHSSHANSHQTRLSHKFRLVAMFLGLLSGLSTVGFGAMVFPLDPASPSSQVAGLYTQEAFNPSPSPSPATGNTIVCWNQVEIVAGVYYWQDSCRGLPPSDTRSCVASQYRLTRSEKESYKRWFYLDRTLPPLCQAKANQIPERLPSQAN